MEPVYVSYVCRNYETRDVMESLSESGRLDNFYSRSWQVDIYGGGFRAINPPSFVDFRSYSQANLDTVFFQKKIPWNKSFYELAGGSGGKDNPCEVIEGSYRCAGAAVVNGSGEEEAFSVFKIILIAALVLGAGYCAYRYRFQAKDWLFGRLYG